MDSTCIKQTMQSIEQISTWEVFSSICPENRYIVMSDHQNIFHAMLGEKKLKKIFVSGTNGPITFGLGMLHSGYKVCDQPFCHTS